MTEVPNYKPNNSKAKEQADAPERKKLEAVVSSETVQRKTPLGRRIAESFTGDDAKSVGNYVLMEVIIPTLKGLLFDSATQGLERGLYGDTRPRQSRTGSGATIVSTAYNKMYRNDRTPGRSEPRLISPRSKAEHDFNEIIIPSKGEAELVIERMSDLIKEYEVASVTDLYDLVNVTGSFADEKWGWDAETFRDAGVRRVREGYLLLLPKPISING